MDNLDKILEGLLFLSGDGLDRGVIMEKLQVTPKQLEKAIEKLKERYNEDCGINFITYKDKLQLCASPKYADDVSLVLNPIRERQLTRATLEVMAIIAYKQPVTRLDVQDIRGINSDYAIQTLLNYKLIEVVGRKDAVGKPLLFGTTDEFLRHFGINNLDELPDYNELMKNIKDIQLENNHLYNEFDIPSDEQNEENAEAGGLQGNELNEKNGKDGLQEEIAQDVETSLNQDAIREYEMELNAENERKVELETDLENYNINNSGTNGTLQANDDISLEELAMNMEFEDNKIEAAKSQSTGIDWSLLDDNPDIENE